jgi:hypothetical protein
MLGEVPLPDLLLGLLAPVLPGVAEGWCIVPVVAPDCPEVEGWLAAGGLDSRPAAAP